MILNDRTTESEIGTMNFENSRTKIQNGYRMIFEDAEEKYVYIALNGNGAEEIPRNELIELIQSGKPLPVIEIKEKIYAASQSASG